MRILGKAGRRLGVGSLALALVLTACGSDADDGEGDADEAEATADDDEPDDADTSDSDDSEPVATGDLDPSATLTYVHDRAIENMDPDRTTTGQPLAFFFPVYDRLVHLTPDGQLTEGLAVERNFLNDGATLELVLREGVTFHDGAPFNAEAVAYNLDRSGTLPDGDQTSRNNVEPIQEVEVIDEFTVHIHRDPDPSQNAAWSLLETRLSENIGMMVSPESADGADFDQNPVGAGPFQVTDFTSERTVYERYDGYWDPDVAGVQELVIFQPPDPEAVAAGLRGGRFDVGSLQPPQIEAAEEDGVIVEVQETNTIFQLWTNHSRPPLDDANFRQALLYGIDRQAIVDVVFDGLGSPTHQPFPPSVPAYNEECGPDAYPYDPDRARELVEASAYADDPTVGLMTNNNPTWIEIAELMQAMLAEGGVNLGIQLNEQAQFGLYFDGEFDMALGRRGRTDPFEALENSWAEGGDSNPGGFNTQSIQDGLAEIASTTDQDERLSLIQDLSCEVIEDGYNPGMWGIARAWGLNECVVGFETPVTPYPEFRGVGIAAGCR